SYETARAALQAVTSWDKTTLVNLVSGSPDDAEETVYRAAEHGAAYLDGCIACYPSDIGSPSGMIVVSGPTALWHEHEDVLMSRGGASEYVCDQVRGAKVLAVGMLGAFYVAALGAYVEAATYVIDQGLSPQALAPSAAQMVALLQQVTPETATAIADDAHETDQATLEIFAEGARAALTAMHAAGHPGRLIEAAVENLDLAESAGLAK